MLDFNQRRSLVAFSTDPARAPLYRMHYGMQSDASALSIDSEGAWQSLPILTKDDLVKVPMQDRTFIPLSEVDHLRTSSGTSGKEPVFIPRTHVRNMDYRLAFHDFKNPFMAFSVPLMPHWHEMFQKAHGKNPQVIVFDPANPAASVRLARLAGVDAFSVFVYHIPSIGESMKREGMNERIRYIEVTGEVCTRAQYEYMRATFPNARIVQSYGASEVEDVHIGMPCRPMDGTEPLAIYHPKVTHYLEILDDSGAVIEPKVGAEGDLLITAYAGEPSAFPLIRFRIGDTIRVVEETCAEHGTWLFTVVGRTDMDFLKIPGGVLRADEAGRVVRIFAGRIGEEFELHRYEVNTDDGPKIQVEMLVDMRIENDLDALARNIASLLRVNPSYTYADGVRDGRYLPLICKAFLPESGKKSKRLIAH